jgi:hypothetical protein
MLHVDIPRLPEIKQLIRVRADACVSIYLPTTPKTAQIGGARIAFGNLTRQALERLDAIGIDKRRRATFEEECSSIEADDHFWSLQANTLAVLITANSIRTYRLATSIPETLEVSDRFLVKPLLRAIAFPQTAFVLALSENAVQLVEIFPDLPPVKVRVPGLPKDAASAVGRASVNNLTQNTRIANAEGQTFLLRQYARKVDTALHGVLAGHELPLILAATQPLAGIYRNLNSYPHLLPEDIAGSPDHLTRGKLASAARPVLDAYYQSEVKDAVQRFQQAHGERRATTDIDEVARAATRGAVELLLIDIDRVLRGAVSQSGTVQLSSKPGPGDYDVIDEIAGRAIETGAHFLAVRQEDLPDQSPLAAVLRYPI